MGTDQGDPARRVILENVLTRPNPTRYILNTSRPTTRSDSTRPDSTRNVFLSVMPNSRAGSRPRIKQAKIVNLRRRNAASGTTSANSPSGSCSNARETAGYQARVHPTCLCPTSSSKFWYLRSLGCLVTQSSLLIPGITWHFYPIEYILLHVNIVCARHGRSLNSRHIIRVYTAPVAYQVILGLV